MIYTLLVYFLLDRSYTENEERLQFSNSADSIELVQLQFDLRKYRFIYIKV